MSHDLRTPLASAKAAVTSLRSHDITWSEQDTDELLATADESLDKLTRLVENLLDMSRLQAGAMSVFPQAGRPRRGDRPRPRRPRPGREDRRRGGTRGSARGPRRSWHPGARDLQPGRERLALLTRRLAAPADG